MLSSSSALYPTTSTLSTADFTKALEFTHQQNESVPQQERIAAEQYLMALRGSPDGLNLAFHIISNEAFQDIRCFWAFNTIIHHLPDVAQSVDGPQALLLYQTLMSWLHRSCQSHILPDFMFNKHAQTVVVGIQELYPSRWTTVFDDLFALLEKRETMPHVRDYLTMYFLRIFEYIDERVVSVRGKDRAREQRQRDMEVKDAMREAVIVQAVQAWYNILCEYRARQPEVARVCLDVLQLYVEWIDIHLVVTSEWMHLLYFVTTLPNLRQSGCDCLFNIVAKKQLPQVKYDTVTAMGIVDALPRIVGMVPVVSSDEEEAFMVSVVSLTNGLAEQLLLCTDAGIAGAAEALHLVVAEVLKLFSIAHFQVRELTLPFVQLYIKSSALGDSEAGELLHLLYRHTIISPSDWLPQQPDDVIDQRKTLHNLMRLMHRRFPQLVIDHCSRVVFQVVSVSSPAELPNIEAEGAMRYLFELGELVRMDVVLKDSTSPFASMIYHLLNCTSIAGHPDPLVHLAYFELMDRYAQFFVHHRDQVAILLQQLLLMPCGITNAQQRVRSRVCYLCSHMLQTLKMQCVPHAAHIVSAMKEVFDHAALVTSDKLDLYEGIGTVMSVSDISMCVEVAERVLLHMDSLANSRSSSDAEAAAVDVADDIAYLSHLAKGIAGTDATKMPDSPPLVAKRDDASPTGFPSVLPPDASQPPLQVFWTVTVGVMRSVEHWSGSVLVRDRACLFMHQMVNILPHTSLCDVFEGFVKNMLMWASAANELPKILRVVYQYVNRTRAASVGVVARLIPSLHERVALMCTNVQNIRSELGVVSEFVKEQAEGYRSYFAVLHAVSHCGCLPALFVDPALPVFGSILQLLVGAVYVSAEFDIPKQALQIMSRLVSQSSSQPEIPGPALFAFMNDSAIPLMLDAFTAQCFDMKDAKNFFLISEFCQMVKSLVTIVGDTALQSLYQVLTSDALQTSGDEAMVVCTRLRDDPRATAQFKSSFRQLLESAQSRRWSHMLAPAVVVS